MTSINPYADTRLFMGRARELERLTRELSRARGALAAVMAGRGMGKTSFATELKLRLERSGSVEVLFWRATPARLDEFLAKLSRDLDYAFTGKLLDEEIVEAVEARTAARTVLLLDEVDNLVEDAVGRTVLEATRIAWENLGGRLGVVVLGGSSIHQLLETKVSPFLRNAEFINLKGFSRAETAQFANQPLGLGLPEAALDWLWHETSGHPALLNEVMKAAVDRSADGEVAGALGATIDDDFAADLESRYFQIWWKNLRPEGQNLYRRLIRHGQPIPRAELARFVSPPADNWLRVLETTGVAVHEAGEVLPRGQLFYRWVRREYLRDDDPPKEHPLCELPDSATPFEREVCLAVARWAAQLPEYAGLGLLTKTNSSARGNDRLAPEAHFQLNLRLALGQHGWHVEAEGWSVGGRSDIKIHEREEAGARCCVELKIWGRGHETVTKQVLDYSLPTDDFAIVVVLDRRARKSLIDGYGEVLDAAEYSIIETATQPMTQPKFITNHERAERPIRVHHVLVELPGD